MRIDGDGLYSYKVAKELPTCLGIWYCQLKSSKVETETRNDVDGPPGTETESAFVTIWLVFKMVQDALFFLRCYKPYVVMNSMDIPR